MSAVVVALGYVPFFGVLSLTFKTLKSKSKLKFVLVQHLPPEHNVISEKLSVCDSGMLTSYMGL